MDRENGYKYCGDSVIIEKRAVFARIKNILLQQVQNK
jgi:hypothetical protein